MASNRSPRSGTTGTAGTVARSAVDRVYAHLADAIISGAIGAGSLVTEGQVAEALGISRTPVREGFLALEAHGLLTLFPKKGAIVTAPDDAETAELLQVRVMLETTAVVLSSARPDAKPVAGQALADLILLQEDAARTEDLLGFARADHRFHARIVDESRNRVIDGIYARLGPRFERLTHRVVARDPRHLERFVAEHRTLADLLLAGDATAYEATLRRHLGDGATAPSAG